MKTFEERYTAWADGLLTGSELESFEADLKDCDAAENDRRELSKLRELLRSQVPELKNPDFFNHQLLQRIEAEQAAPRRKPSYQFFSIPWLRFALAGLAALVIGWFLGIAMNPVHNQIASTDVKSAGITNIIAVEPLESGISASVLNDDQDDFTVVWLDGLDYIPASYELQ